MYYHYINWWRERKKEKESSFKQSTANYTFILLISLISPMFLYQLVVTNDILLHFKEGFLYRHIDCLHPNYALCSLTVYIAWCVNTLCIYTATALWPLPLESIAIMTQWYAIWIVEQIQLSLILYSVHIIYPIYQPPCYPYHIKEQLILLQLLCFGGGGGALHQI